MLIPSTTIVNWPPHDQQIAVEAITVEMIAVEAITVEVIAFEMITVEAVQTITVVANSDHLNSDHPTFKNYWNET